MMATMDKLNREVRCRPGSSESDVSVRRGRFRVRCRPGSSEIAARNDSGQQRVRCRPGSSEIQ